MRKVLHSCIVVLTAAVATGLILSSCSSVTPAAQPVVSDTSNFLHPPLITHVYTADPSARVFKNRIYIYPSHDIETGAPQTGNGDHFDMRDYRVFSLIDVGGKVTDHGVVLTLENIPWAKRQLWAPDAAYRNGRYYFYFPAKDSNDIFRIGVATSSSPAGPFKAEPQPIEGSFSIDPAVFTDTTGISYMYFGGIWGGQLQKWAQGSYDSSAAQEPQKDQPALHPKVAVLRDDMLQFDGAVRDVVILDTDGTQLLSGDDDRRFFEGAWMHRYNGRYYLSYSTGNTHYLAYAIGDNPLGPFRYQGTILEPVQGWTTHHSIVEYKGRWFLFYHDTQLSNKTHLRNIKVTELKYRADGSIETISAFKK